MAKQKPWFCEKCGLYSGKTPTDHAAGGECDPSWVKRQPQQRALDFQKMQTVPPPPPEPIKYRFADCETMDKAGLNRRCCPSCHDEGEDLLDYESENGLVHLRRCCEEGDLSADEWARLEMYVWFDKKVPMSVVDVWRASVKEIQNGK